MLIHWIRGIMVALITDGSYKNSLAILRTLGEKKIEVYSSSHKNKSLSCYSKYCKKHFVYSNPLKYPDKFKNEMTAIVRNFNIDVLIPVGVAASILISQHKNELEKYTSVPVADYKNLIKAHDKMLINGLAEKNGVPVPKTFVPESQKELKNCLKELGLPVMIKARKGAGFFNLARSEKEAKRIWKQYEKRSKESKFNEIIDFSLPVIQEYLPGEIIDVLFIFNKGKIKGLLTQKRHLMLPPDGGVGALNITINEPKTAFYAAKLMKKLNWHGVGMAEFKRDGNGEPKLIEVNPKFWGTTEASISAGMNFPHMLYRMAKEGDIEPNFTFLYPKRFGWPLPMGIKQIMESRTPFYSMKEYLRLFGLTNSHDIRLMTDPRPFSYQILQSIKIILLKLLQKKQQEKINLDDFR